MKKNAINFAVLVLLVFPLFAQQPTSAPAPERVAKEFEHRVKQYVDLRDKLDNDAPKLKDKATPEAIAAHRAALTASIRAARAGAQPGDIFFPQMAEHIRAVVLDDMRGRKGAAAKSMSDDGDPKVEGSARPVRVEVNAIYPDSAPNSSVPPDLLAKLPVLPEEVQYRFVGRDLILRDATATIILDYIRNVTPATSQSATQTPAAAPAAAQAAVAPPPLAAPPQQTDTTLNLQLPNKKDSLRFAVIGDTGTGDKAAFQVASELAAYHKVFPFDFVIMMGDNLYGGESPRDYQRKFEQPYKALLDAGVKFYAALGNHDDPSQRFYKNFNMGGERFYTFSKDQSTRFFALDSNYMDRPQVEWLEKQLRGSASKWKVAFFHHPPYSSGEKHGSQTELRKTLEPMFIKYGVSAVFTGHEHFYERIKPQQGIYYFIQGSSAKLREGNIARTNLTAKGFDSDYTFMLVEIDGDTMWFQTITRGGKTVDSGGLRRPIPAAEVAKQNNAAPKQ